VTLNAYCFNNPVSYAWSGVGLTSTVGIQTQANYNVTGLQTYTVTATNGAGSGQAFVTVNWGGIVGPPVPSCTLSASNTTPTVGQSVTLTSSCTNSPSTYTWSNCTSTGPTCVDVATAPGAKVYTVRGANGSGPGNVATVQVNWQVAPTAPPVCTVASSNPAPFTGQLITLTATCSNSPASGSYVWTNCNSTQSTCSTTSTVATTVTYSVTAANSLGTSPPVSVPVTWQQSVGGIDFCGTNPNVVRTSEPWGGGRLTPGVFPSNRILVIAVTVPPTSYADPRFEAQSSEWRGTAVWTEMSLSRSSCDFRPVDPSGVVGPISAGGTNNGIVRGVVGSNMLPGETFYVNVRWAAGFTCEGITGGGSSCESAFNFIWPR
jgi:hypothetical protein